MFAMRIPPGGGEMHWRGVKQMVSNWRNYLHIDDFLIRNYLHVNFLIRNYLHINFLIKNICISTSWSEMICISTFWSEIICIWTSWSKIICMYELPDQKLSACIMCIYELPDQICLTLWNAHRGFIYTALEKYAAVEMVIWKCILRT